MATDIPRLEVMGVHSRVLLMPNPVVMFAIARAIRPLVGFVAAAAYSDRDAPVMRLARDVDAVAMLDLPPAEEWTFDRRELGPKRAAWVGQVAAICREHDVQYVLPASDLEQYILTLGAERLAQAGVHVLGPPHATVRRLNDKWLLMDLAKRHGLATPRTQLASAVHDDALSPESRYVLKRRFSQGATGLRILPGSELREALREVEAAETLDNWIVQDYVPGRFEPSITVYGGECSGLVLHHVKHRYLAPGGSTAVEVVEPFTNPSSVVSFVAESRLVGPAGMQWKIDERDGVPRLLEMNARPGQNTRFILRMLASIGADPGRVLLESYAGTLADIDVPIGTIGVSPLDDFLTFRVRRAAAAGGRNTRDNPVPSSIRHLLDVASSYVGRRVVLDIPVRDLLRDWRSVRLIYRRLATNSRREMNVPWSGVRRFSPIRTVARLHGVSSTGEGL